MNVAPTLATSCAALPPEGAAAPAARQSRFRGPCWREEDARRKNARTLFTAGVLRCPPRGRNFAWGGPARRPLAPTLFTSCNALPSEAAGLAWGGLVRRPFSGKIK